MSSILLINDIMEVGEGTARTLKKIFGKLIDIRNLILGAKFHLAHIIMDAGSISDKEDPWFRADLWYFSLVPPAYARRTELKDPDRKSRHLGPQVLH